MTPILLKELRPGKWYVVYHAAGRRWVRKVSEDKKEAEQIRAALEKKRLKDGYKAIAAFKSHGRVSELTFATYADRWLKEVENSGLKPSTKISYKLQVVRHLKPHFGDLPLTDLTYARVKEFISDKLEARYAVSKKEGAAVRKYSNDSIRLMIASLRAMMEEAMREELIDDNPVVRRIGKLFGSAARVREEPDPFSREELHRLEEVAGDWLPFLLFQSRTGARVGEAIALQWQDIDFAKAEAIIRRTMPPNRQVGTPKTLASLRTVELSPQLVDALQALQKEQREYWFGEGKEVPAWVFCKHNPGAPTYSVWRRAFLVMLRRAKIRPRRVHDIRHTWASQMLLAGKPLAWIAKQLGHRSPQVTLSIYAHWIQGEDHGAKDILDCGSELRKRQQTATEDKQ